VIDLPDCALEAPSRLDALAALGAPLREALEPRLGTRLGARGASAARARRPSRAA
jgi:hypothetical protein